MVSLVNSGYFGGLDLQTHFLSVLSFDDEVPLFQAQHVALNHMVSSYSVLVLLQSRETVCSFTLAPVRVIYRQNPVRRLARIGKPKAGRDPT